MTRQAGHIIDVSATFVEITGAEYPKQINGNETKPPVGISLLPVFEGKQRKPHQEIDWRFKKANTIRQGDLKAICAGNSWELYDLKSDPTEMSNLAGKRRKKAKEFAEMWELWNADSVSESSQSLIKFCDYFEMLNEIAGGTIGAIILLFVISLFKKAA